MKRASRGPAEVLLSRDAFREGVWARFGGRCVMACGREAVDAHHILKRRLFTSEGEEGGYLLASGAGLCATCHLLAEQTLISCETLYEACGVARRLPRGGQEEALYDTWGNEVVAPGVGVKGPLGSDAGCPRALASGGLLWRGEGRVPRERWNDCRKMSIPSVVSMVRCFQRLEVCCLM